MVSLLFSWYESEGAELRKAFPGYTKEQILNSLAEKHKRLKPGDLLDGVLLGHAAGRIPMHYTSPCVATIRVYDTLGSSAKVEFETLLHRSGIKFATCSEARLAI